MKRLNAFLGVLAASAAVGGCGGTEYSATLRQEWMDTCLAMDSSARGACECMLDKVQNRVSADELERANVAMSIGLTPDSKVQNALLDVARDCAEG